MPTSYRMVKYASFASDAWHRKNWQKMKPGEREFCQAFIEAHDHLSKAEFEFACSRMFIDKPELRAKYRNWTAIVELAASTNVGFPL